MGPSRSSISCLNAPRTSSSRCWPRSSDCWGVALLFVLFCLVVFRGFWLAAQSQEDFGRLVAAGFVSSFFIHVFVNVGMVSGLLPVVGLPLPLISYGGTSLVTTMATFGIVMSTFSHRRMLAE